MHPDGQHSCTLQTSRRQGALLISRFTGLESAVGLRPALWTVDHTSSITCCYLLPGCHTGSKLYCLVTEAHGCEQLAHSRYVAAPDRGSNPQPLDRKSDALSLRYEWLKRCGKMTLSSVHRRFVQFLHP